MGYQPRSASRCGCGSSSTLMPTMASPRPRETLATTFYDDPSVIADVSRGLGEAMVGINVGDLAAPHRLAERGW